MTRDTGTVCRYKYRCIVINSAISPSCSAKADNLVGQTCRSDHKQGRAIRLDQAEVVDCRARY